MDKRVIKGELIVPGQERTEAAPRRNHALAAILLAVLAICGLLFAAFVLFLGVAVSLVFGLAAWIRSLFGYGRKESTWTHLQR